MEGNRNSGIRLALLRHGLAVGILALLFGPGLAGHIRNAANRFVFAEDVRIHVWPYLRYQDPGLFPGDYTCDYLLDCAPVGHRALFHVWALWFDVRTLSKAIPYLLLGVVLACVAFTAKSLGGNMAAWCAVALCLASNVFMARMTGGLARAFAYPLVSVAAAALVAGRPYWVVAVVLVGAAYYPVAAVVAGLSLAVYLLLLPASQRGSASGWSLPKRAAILVIGAAGATIILGTMTIPCSTHGTLLRPSDVEQFPEFGAGGRWQPESRAPYPGFVAGAAKEAWRFFADPHRKWIIEVDRKVRNDGWRSIKQPDVVALAILAAVIATFMAAGFGGLLKSEPAARRLVALLAGAPPGGWVRRPS